MKYLLSITLCSMLESTCIPPHIVPEMYNDLYNCQLAGYRKPIAKIEEIGTDKVNEFKIYTAFSCKPINTT